ncbi:MAG: magnesium/cobalt efflux protein [Legionellales bacterium RIFCSPHIGHO2_12_FULL_37_14]|nr:MAG: magnesium/cobalt efflux protein [Legionellales bacterium RIFCSPHIGHO2_12_FULL_37_14]
MSNLLLLLILFILIVLSGFFSASEIGMMSLNRYRLKHLVKKGNLKAIRVSNMLKRPDYLLSVVLIGNTLGNIFASTIATLLGQKLYGDLGVVTATSLLTIVILVFAEMAPKTVAAVYPEKVAFFTSWLLRVFQIIFSPLVWLITRVSSLTLSLFSISTKELPKDFLSQEELRTVLVESGGVLPSDHKRMLISLLDIEHATVEDIMIPKADLIGIDIEEPWHTVLNQLSTSQHTRLPIYRSNIERLVGLVHVKNILHLAVDETLTLETLLEIADPPYFIPESTKLNVQILHFRKLRKRCAFVVDEYGELQGLATLEDILEEIVGEFTTDMSIINKDIVPLENGIFLLDAGTTIRDVNRALGWNLPLIGPKTISGLIIETLGSIPPADCCLKIGPYAAEILKVQDNLVKSVKMWLQNKAV